MAAKSTGATIVPSSSSSSSSTYAVPNLELSPKPLQIVPPDSNSPSQTRIGPNRIPSPAISNNLQIHQQQGQPVPVVGGADYIAAREVHRQTAKLFVAEAQLVGNDVSVMPHEHTQGRVFVVPTLSPRDSDVEIPVQDHSSNVPYSDGPDWMLDTAGTTETRRIDSNDDAPEYVYMHRTASQISSEPLSVEGLTIAQQLRWRVPSSSFQLLTERLIGFYVLYDRPKATYKYIDRMLKSRFGEQYIGNYPDRYAEQELQNYLGNRYLSTSCFQKNFCAPACYGGYDNTALGWATWWRNVMLLPGVAALAAGLILASLVQAHYLTGYVTGPHANKNDSLKLRQKADSIVDGVRYQNWEVSPYDLKETVIPLEASSSHFANDALVYVPSVQVSSFINHEVLSHEPDFEMAIRTSWTLLDDVGNVVHEFAETTIAPGHDFGEAFATNCESSDSLSCSVATDEAAGKRTKLANWTKPYGGPAHGCIVDLNKACVPFDTESTVSPSISGTYRFPKNAISTKSVSWPLSLKLQSLEYRTSVLDYESSKTQLTPISGPPDYIRIILEANISSRVLSDFLTIVGIIMLVFGGFFVGLVFCVYCVECTNGRNERVYSEFYTDKSGRRKYRRRKRVSINDDIHAQIYFIWCCCDSLPGLCMHSADWCDQCCQTFGGICAYLVNACGSCIQYACVSLECIKCKGGDINSSGCLYYCALCGDGCAECGDSCMDVCANCNCDCGAMDCAC